MRFKRLLTLILTAILLLTFIPFSSSGAADRPEDVWELIDSYENGVLFARYGGSFTDATAKDYSSMTDGVIRVVESWSGYAEGTVERHGDFFFWEGGDGTAYGYSPLLREKLRSAKSTLEAEDYTGSYEINGGTPGSSDVTVIQPYYGLDDSFTLQYVNEGESIADVLGGKCSVYRTNAATVDVIADSISNSAVVFLDSHGLTDYEGFGDDYWSRANTSYLCINTGSGLTRSDMAAVQGDYGRYYHAFNAGSDNKMNYWCIDGTAIANHMETDAKCTFLWSAICLGMTTSGIEAPMREKGVEVVYGYSQSVTFSADYRWEKVFWDEMKEGKTVAEAANLMKIKVGVNDPYEINYPAYPVFVSSEDPYPGHGKVDALQTVNSTWTLFSNEHTVSAFSNDPSLGTVSVRGNMITAIPNENVRVAGYEVTSGSAKVDRNGNVFTVTPRSDCTVRIDFEVMVPATVNFVTPDGVTCENIETITGETVVLPAPFGDPAADARDYAFAGWSRVQVPDTEEVPDHFNAGDEFEVDGDVTLYALYRYRVWDPDNKEFTKVKSSDKREDWNGTYILMCKQLVLDGSGEYTGDDISASSAARPIADLGITLSKDGNTLQNVDDRYAFDFNAYSESDGIYTIRMHGGKQYLRYSTDTSSLSTSSTCDSAEAKWNFTKASIFLLITNSTNSKIWLGFKENCFGCFDSIKILDIYEKESVTSYTTELEYACDHDLSLVFSLEPTCEENGLERYFCSKCEKYFENVVPAIGHDWQDQSYAWNDDLSEATASAVCANDHTHTLTETVKTTSEVTVPATETDDGEIVYHRAVRERMFRNADENGDHSEDRRNGTLSSLRRRRKLPRKDIHRYASEGSLVARRNRLGAGQ